MPYSDMSQNDNVTVKNLLKINNNHEKNSKKTQENQEKRGKFAISFTHSHYIHTHNILSHNSID